MSFGVKRLIFLIFIFYFTIVILEHVNFRLVDSTQIQSYTMNKNYKIGGNNADIYTTLYFLAL